MKLPWTPAVTVGRELDPRLAILTGEGAQQRVRRPHPTGESALALWEERPSLPQEGGRDYYRVPLLKEPVWIWSVPLYFYFGGIAGGSAVLGALLHRRRALRTLARACRWGSFVGTTVGPALLTWDLGKKGRFYKMLRVVRPTSPMSIGSWTLAGSGALATLSLLLGERKSAAPANAALAGGGLILAGYTGVLLGNSANPLWHETRRTLPVLFTASAMASTAAALEMLPLNAREEGVVHTFGIMGKVAEAASMVAMERDAARNPHARKALVEGSAGLLWQSAKGLLAAGIVVGMIPGRSRWKRALGGALTSAGALCLRFALLESGKAAVREPQAVIARQRD